MKNLPYNLLFIFFAVFAINNTFAQTPLLPVNGAMLPSQLSAITPYLPQHPTYIQNQICFTHSYPFVNYHKNYIEWENYAAIAPFFEKLKQSGSEKVKILHLGDSHIQADIYPAQFRKKLHQAFGSSGRGMVFPYSVARTHAGTDYVTFCRGRWDYAKNVQWLPRYDLGLSGVTVHTKDRKASFMLKFKQDIFERNGNVLKIYCKKSKQSFDLELVTSGLSEVINIDCNDETDNLPYITVQIPEDAGEILQFSVVKNEPEQTFFECHGLSFENTTPQGIAYHSAGVNGAGFRSFARQNLLPEQLAEFKPDLIIVDVGINDFFPLQKLETRSMGQMVRSFIEVLQAYSPQSSILLVSVQEACHRQKRLSSTQEFSQLARQIAFEKNCAFYDFYEVSGGQNSMLAWQKGGLAKRDLLHLSSEGYQHKGELLANALITSYHLALTKEDSIKRFTLQDAHRIDSTYRTLSVFLNPQNLQLFKEENTTPVEISMISTDGGNIYEQAPTPKAQTVYYKVKQGDNLGIIAARHHTSVYRLQAWNHLKGTAIRQGQTLVIHRGNYQETVAHQPTLHKKKGATSALLTTYKPTPTPAATPKTHKVKRGDNLWGIAKKYHISVETLTRLNNLANNGLQIGQILRLQ